MARGETVALVLVGIEVDGRRCGDRCRLFVNEDDRGNDPYCAAFGSLNRIKRENGTKRSHYRRNPDCFEAALRSRPPSEGES